MLSAHRNRSVFKTFVLSIAVLLTGTLHAQTYFQQELRYNIRATLNDADNSIDAAETLVYKNNAQATLDFIWFHIWPNAYKNKKTALMKQIKKDKSRSKKEDNYGEGYIDGLNFVIAGKPARTEPHPDHIDIVKVFLDKPLAPGDSVTISTPFKVKLPPYFSRSGYADGEYMVTQWYPKPAVFDKDGWHEFPYLDMGEFYSEYASYDVSITVPSGYVVAATGNLQTQAELEAYKTAGAKNVAARTGTATPYQSPFSTPTKTLQYKATNVPDFAWFADKKYLVQYDTIGLPSGRIVDAFSFYYNNPGTIWTNSIDYIKDGTRKYSSWIGEYDYPVVQVVEGPKNNSSGGMEYPMVTLITSPDAKVETLDAVIVHEVGHNWFMSMLGSNERVHAWMDEGLNSYYQFRYEAEKYRGNSIFGDAIPADVRKMPVAEFQNLTYRIMAENIPIKSAMDVPSDQFPDSEEYGLASYVKPALWMYMLEQAVGRDKVDAALQNYFKKWKFKHPQPVDMKQAFEEAIGGKLDQFFELINKKGKLE